MNTKKNITKLVLIFSVAVGIMGFTPSKAINLTLNVGDIINQLEEQKKIRPIHFKEFENDFGGFFYFNSIDDIFLPPENDGEPGAGDDDTNYNFSIKGGDNRVDCKDQLRGFYYNAERGERLWPIDLQTMEDYGMDNQGLTMTGGIYTNCTPSAGDYSNLIACCKSDLDSREENCADIENRQGLVDLGAEECIKQVKNDYLDSYSFYGGITHQYSGQNFILAMGINYHTGTIWIQTEPKLGKTFQRHPEEGFLPFGLVYDNLGGVGFAGCEIVETEIPVTVLDNIIGDLEGGAPIYTLFQVSTGADGKKYLVYTRDINVFPQRINCKDIGQDNESALKILVEGLIGMGEEDDIEYYKQIDASRDLEKTQYFASININNATLINHARQKAEMLCRGKWTGNNTQITTGINCILGPKTLTEDDRNKTIIVKNGNVTIEPFSADANDYYDIFIDSGNLIINEESTAGKFVIKNNGFVSDGDIVNFITNVNTIKSNNSIPPNENMWSDLNEIGIASILKGNFIVNGSIKPSGVNTGLNNKYFVYGKLTSLDKPQILREVFTWRCNNGYSNETEVNGGYPCPGPKVGGKSNQYQKAPLVIIDQNYNSPLLK